MHRKRYACLLANRWEVLIVERFPRFSWELPIIEVLVSHGGFWHFLGRAGVPVREIDAYVQETLEACTSSSDGSVQC